MRYSRTVRVYWLFVLSILGLTEEVEWGRLFGLTSVALIPASGRIKYERLYNTYPGHNTYCDSAQIEKSQEVPRGIRRDGVGTK